MKISVVIPAYNEERFLPRCLESLQKQLEPAAEIIVVDNNSKDATAQIAHKYGATVVHESKQGISFARNAGFNVAQHEIIARCDADNILPPDWIKNIRRNFEAFESGKIIAVTGPCYFFDYEWMGPLKVFPKWMQTFYYFISTKAVLGYVALFGSNMAITREAWLKVKDEVCTLERQFHEDIDISIHLSRFGVMKYDPKLLVSISARRVHSLKAYTDYPWRWVKTLIHGKKMKRGS